MLPVLEPEPGALGEVEDEVSGSVGELMVFVFVGFDAEEGELSDGIESADDLEKTPRTKHISMV